MIPKECQSINQKILDLKAEKRDLQSDLIGLTGAGKWTLLQHIAVIQGKITTLNNQLNSCIVQHGGKIPLSATLSATFSLRTSFKDALGPFTGSETLPVLFDASRTIMQVTNFPPFITPPFHTPVGNNVTTVKMIGGGFASFDSSNGTMSLPIQLYLDQSINIPFYTEDSTITFNLTTGSVTSPIGNLSGSPLDAQGNIRLVGASTFVDGILDKSFGTLEIIGAISPHP
ncbi:hypothetical protein SAMN04487897_109104 [Paenibacillus sp. yr247]|uniref:hypothetical protein n=1 Tax=Paenibacillus sp. yr247 TaxID=1761880 RepID=UPI000887D67A|nr:hypothetical protein [Paenibacillus sp. yr247]SDO17534.1 hypothetical protein SAMN04487897_109104 [Paenibacillus sp. yr247]